MNWNPLDVAMDGMFCTAPGMAVDGYFCEPVQIHGLGLGGIPSERRNIDEQDRRDIADVLTILANFDF